MAIFPVEVYDLIIDQVPIFESFSRDLASCAMVCRSWASRSRSHQFKSLNFTTGNRLSLFLDLISSPHATIAPHVRHIIFAITAGEQSILMRIASLRELESIFIKGYNSTSSDVPRVEEIVAWLGSCTNLRRLELSYFSLDSFSQLRDIVCACRGLERIYMHSVRTAVVYCVLVRGVMYHDTSPPELQAPYGAQPEGSSPCPPLQVLRTIDSLFNEQLLEWVGGCASSLPLRSLCIGLDAVVRYQALLGRLLRALGPTLEQLSIQRSPLFREAHAISYEHIDLRYNTQLKVLSFSGCSWKVIQYQVLGLAYQVSSSNLRELNISLDHISISNFNNMVHAGAESLPELAAIDTLLQRPNFANLERLNIGLPRVVDSIREFFPHTAARNILRLIDIKEMALGNGEGSVCM